MSRYIHLSHVLDPADVAYVGEPVLELASDSVIDPEGKPFNAHRIHLPNHFGTHMDAPRHFNPNGITMVELPDSIYAYEGDEVLVIDLPHRCVPGGVIMQDDLEPFAGQIKGKRLLLLRTGFEKYKHSDPDLYQKQGLSLHPDACRWLIEKTDSVQCIGMDWLSIASPTNDYGVDAHHWLLGVHTDRYITGVEDMSMAALGDAEIEFVTLGPLRVKGVDSAQVNIMARVQ